MKKSLFLFLLLFGFSTLSFAQVIPNSSFELWSVDTIYEEPDTFFTTNQVSSMITGTPNVTKSTSSHSGNYAVRLETVAAVDDTIMGAMFLNPKNGDPFAGGVAYTSKPDSVRISVKHNIQANDTASIFLIFKMMGNPIGLASSSFTGTQGPWKTVTFPTLFLNPLLSPDTVSLFITSSDMDGEGIPGSVLYVDDLTMVGSGVAQIPNSGFEDWTSIVSEDPTDWVSLNAYTYLSGKPSVTKTTDSYSGSFAARIESVLMFDDTIGMITNGNLDAMPSYGGMKVNQNPHKLTGYYKYTPVGPDTALVGIYSYVYDQGLNTSFPVDSAQVKLIPSPSYTPFEVDFHYDKWPYVDTVEIAFASGNLDDGPYIGLGSVLIIDSLNLSYKPLSINKPSVLEQDFIVFPNPSDGKFNIKATLPVNDVIKIRIFDSFGRIVSNEQLYFERVKSYDISGFPAGFYLFEIETISNKYAGKLLIR
jgi:hypothetical protein